MTAYYPGIDLSKFRGFAVRNESGEDVAIKVVNEASFPEEFILRNGQVYYAYVGDVVKVLPLDWAKKSYIPYLKDKIEPKVEPSVPAE